MLIRIYLLDVDGSLSDTALNTSLLDCQLPDRSSTSWRRSGPTSSASSSGGLAHSSSASQQHYAKSDKSGLSKKSNSTSQLSATGQCFSKSLCLRLYHTLPFFSNLFLQVLTKLYSIYLTYHNDKLNCLRNARHCPSN